MEHAVRILSLADDLDVAVARDHALEALADHRVIVGDHESNHASPMSFGIAIGTRSRTAVHEGVEKGLREGGLSRPHSA